MLDRGVFHHLGWATAPWQLRSEFVTFLSSDVVCGRKAPKSICQQASPGFLRLRSGQALRLRAIKPSVCDRSAKRFAQDDGFVEGSKNISTKGPQNCRSLGFARDHKGKSDASLEGGCWTEATTLYGAFALSFVIPSEAEGSAVLSTSHQCSSSQMNCHPDRSSHGPAAHPR